MRTKIINEQLTDLFYNFIEMEDRIAANDRYADLNSSDMRFLSAVGKGSHPRTITQVGDYLRVGRQTAHHASSSLIRRGYITKMTNPNDARSQWLILTDKGMEAVAYYRNRIRSNVKGMCILPFFLLTEPAEAKRLLIYRGRGLQGAKTKAYRNGYKGAMYPWEAARPEYGETTPERGMADPQTGERTSIYTGKKELHISADISHAVWKYYQATGDEEFMKQWGDEILLATAVFWADRVEWDEDGRVCHIRDVIGPDEYKQRLTDNTYTNYMARNNLRLAVQIAERLEKEDPEYLEELNNRWEICEMLPKIRRAAEGIYLPPVGKDGILPQFAGYGKLQEMDLSYYKSFGKNAAAEMRKEHTVLELESFRVHKQADLVLLLQLFPELPEEAGGTQRRQVREKNYEFYEKHTLHEASYSFATHSLMAASLGRTQEAYELFCQCCDVDLSSDGENAPAGIYAACMGGIWQCVVEGFCGVRIEEDALRIDPCLPETWESVKFRICYRKSTLDIKVTKNALTVNNRSSHPVPLSFRGEEVCLDGTVSRIFPLHSPE